MKNKNSNSSKEKYHGQDKMIKVKLISDLKQITLNFTRDHTKQADHCYYIPLSTLEFVANKHKFKKCMLFEYT